MRYLNVIIILLFLCSCNEDDFLDTKPLGRVSDDTYFSTESGAIQAVNGCYDGLQKFATFKQGHIEITECISDNAEVGGNASEYEHEASQDLSRFISNTANSVSSSYWNYQYRGIARCNDVISRVPEIEMDEELKLRLIGEAKFLRALYYFCLNNVYGGVPIVDHPLLQDEYYSTPRSKRLDVFLFIAEDLKEARENLPLNYDAANIGRATRGAANALLAKTYLFIASMKKYDKYIEFDDKGFDPENKVDANQYWELAKKTAELVINSDEYELITGEFTRFAGQPYEHKLHAFDWLFTLEGDNCKEKIFEIQYYDGLSGTGGNYHEGNDIIKWSTVRDAIEPDGTKISNPGFGFFTPTQDLYDEFEAEDTVRLNATIMTDEDSILWLAGEDSIAWCRCDHRQSPTGYSNGKARAIFFELHGGGSGSPPTQSGINNTLIRYAEVILIHAEACMELGFESEARADLKMIRNRVGLSDYPTDPRFAQLKEAVYHERRVELAMEQHRWFDLVRWGRTKDELSGTSYGDAFIEGKHEYLPIHETQVSISQGSIVQNRNW